MGMKLTIPRELEVALDEAVALLNPLLHGSPAEDLPYKRRWLAKWAIQAVCQAAVQKNQMRVPFAVRLCREPAEEEAARILIATLEEQALAQRRAERRAEKRKGKG